MDVLVQIQSRAVMPSSVPNLLLECRLTPFHPRWARAVASWVGTPEELRQLSPSTPFPLTEAKVADWGRPGGQQFVLIPVPPDDPVGYAELNPLHARPKWYWLGHVLIKKEYRGKGLGLTLTRYLADFAFGQGEAEGLALIVHPQNRGAIRCYERAGFQRAGSERHRTSQHQRRERLLRMELRKKVPGLRL